jgi:hypothetical protein
MHAYLSRYPAVFASCAAVVLLTGFYVATGALSASELPSHATSRRQATGMALMLIVLPAYIIATSFVCQRRSLGFIEQLRGEFPDPGVVDEAASAVRGALGKSWVWGGLAGLAMAPFNTQLLDAIARSSTQIVDLSISIGQFILWVSVGLAGGMRVVAARAFSRLGDRIEIDLTNPARLQPLARSRLLDVVVIAGGLALTAFQSLDAEFRWANYRSSVLVMIPGATLLLFWPLRSLHQRMRGEKRRQIAKIDKVVSELRTARTGEEIARFEILLAHRDRVHQQRTWPLDTSLISRFAFYVVIPPLAWIGAALVENVIDRLVTG